MMEAQHKRPKEYDKFDSRISDAQALIGATEAPRRIEKAGIIQSRTAPK